MAPQHAHTKNEWSGLVSTLSSVVITISRMEEAAPMARWTEEQLDSFVRESKPVAERYQLASRYLQAKQRENL